MFRQPNDRQSHNVSEAAMGVVVIVDIIVDIRGGGG